VLILQKQEDLQFIHLFGKIKVVYVIFGLKMERLIGVGIQGLNLGLQNHNIIIIQQRK